MKSAIDKPKIIDLDRLAKRQLTKVGEFVIQMHLQKSDDSRDLFLVLSGSALSKHADVAEKILHRVNKPRVVFVELDTDVNAVLENFSIKPWRHLLPATVIFDKWNLVDRILHAWRDKAQEERIALAWVEGNTLKVKSCSLKNYDINFDEVKALAQICPDKKRNFEIDEFGRHLYWPDYDLHVDIIDLIRYRKDAKYKKQRDIRDITHNAHYGRAISALREMYKLTQKNIEEKTGLTERQLRRVEREGHSLSIDVAEKLASAHNLSLTQYLNTVAKVVSKLPKSKN